VPAIKAMLMADFIDFSVELRARFHERSAEQVDDDHSVISQLMKKEAKHKPNMMGSTYLYCTLEGVKPMKRILDGLQAHFNSNVWPWTVTVDREID
jgi:hypothetical protein